jgi:predicted RNase H-like HicB family nuclease
VGGQCEGSQSLVTYHAIHRVELDGRWFVEIPEIQGCHAHAKTFQEARVRIREALTEAIADGGAIEIVDTVQSR